MIKTVSITHKNSNMSDRIFQHLPDHKKEEIRQKNRIYRKRLAEIERDIKHPSHGYFGPNSVSWRIYREPVIVLGGMRAVLLQTAHPAVAQGVEDNSDFRNNLFARGRRTIQALYALIFGDLERARGVATRVYNVHHLVTGTVANETDSTWSGQHYTANDPELLNWVAATVAETSIQLYETLFGPLTDTEKSSFAHEYRTAATLNGIPSEHHFQTTDEMGHYVSEMLNSREIAVGDIGRGIARTLFKNPYTPSAFDERFTIGLLPPSIRDAYGLPWSNRDQARHEQMLRLMRASMQTIPGRLRYVPAYHQARARVDQTFGHRPSRIGRFINWADQKLYVPLALH